MNIEIRSWVDNRVLFSCEAESLKQAVELAVKQKVDLACAILTCADLTRADLTDADLACAKMTDADLACAKMTDADLTGADLKGIKLGGIEIPVVPDLDAKILAALESGGKLNMASWHTCATTHCRAGWAVVVAGDAGEKLERATNTQAAAILIYEKSTGRVPDFFASDEDALADIRACAAAAKGAST